MRKVIVPLGRLLVATAILLIACNSVSQPTPTPRRAQTIVPTRMSPTVAPASIESTPLRTPTPAVRPCPTAAPGGACPPTAGPTEITGEFKYSNDIITTYYVEQAVALVDMYGFVKRDLNWEIPVKSQTLGYLKIDPQAKTGSYWLELPAKPDGQVVDVANDGQTGVQIFAVAYWPNLTGGPFSEGDDPSRGWPNYLASVKTDSANKDEVTGGKLVVWAPDNKQKFPTGFGADGLLFTADDPTGPLPAGYSVVDLDKKPFDISQPAKPQLELYEPKDAAIKDYSNLSYADAFEQLFKFV